MLVSCGFVLRTEKCCGCNENFKDGYLDDNSNFFCGKCSEEKMQKTRSQIIEETINYYSDSKKRGLSDKNICQYITKDGNMCAVGRCLINPSDPKLVAEDGDDTVQVEDIENLDNLLKEEYRGHPLDFWTHLQMWHDSNNHFDENGITEKGKNAMWRLRTKWTGGLKSILSD